MTTPESPSPNGHTRSSDPLDPAWMRKFKAQQAAKAAADPIRRRPSVAVPLDAKEEVSSDPSSPPSVAVPLDPAWMRKWKREQEEKAEVAPEISVIEEADACTFEADEQPTTDNRKKMQPGELPAWAKKYGGRSSRLEAAEEQIKEERIAEIFSPEPAAANTSPLAASGGGNRPKLSEMRKAEAERKGRQIATCRVGDKVEYIIEASPIASPAAAADHEDEIEVSANGPMSGPAATTNTPLGFSSTRASPKLSELRKREAARKNMRR